MPRTYSPPKTRAGSSRATADASNPKAILSRAQRRKKRGSARVQRSTRRSRSVSRSEDQQATPAPLVQGSRLTEPGRQAAARGEQEYQDLVHRFEGCVHLSRGRPAAANARLKLISASSSSRPSSQSTPRARRRCAAEPPPPPPDDQDLQVSFLSESESEEPAPGDAGGPVGQVQASEEEKSSIVTVPRARAPEKPGKSGQSEPDAGAAKLQQDDERASIVTPLACAPEKEGNSGQSARAAGAAKLPEEVSLRASIVTVPRAPETECGQKDPETGVQHPRKHRAVATEPRKRRRKSPQEPRNRGRVQRARLLELAARYKASHQRFQAQQQADSDSDADDDVPEGEFEVEFVLCSDHDGTLLVKWAGFDLPSWEPAAAIPDAIRETYRRAGRVELRDYLALIEVAC